MGKKSRAKRAAERTKTRPQPPQTTTTQVGDRKRAAIIAAAIFISVVVVYAQLSGHDFFRSDDPIYVPQNEHVTSGLSIDNIRWALTNIHAAYWIPLTWISYMVDVQLFGVKPGMLLMTNLVLHGLNAILLFLLLRRATASTWPSAAVAALFALHPLHVESVAWVTERKDVLSTFFFMLALWLYITWVGKRTAARYALMIITFALGLMAKPMVVTLPFVLLLFDWWPLRRFHNWKGPIIEKLPLFALSVVSALITLKAQKPAIGTTIPIGERLANALTSYVAYLGKTFWPTNLAVIYPWRAISTAAVVGSLLLLMAITAAVLRFARSRPYLPVGWFWYLGTLVPVIGIVQAGKQSMADRFTYIPLIGIFIAVVWLLSELAIVRKFAPALAAAVLITLGAISYVQAGYWKDSVTLARHALEVTRDNDQAHIVLGSALSERGDRQAAEQEFKAAMTINPRNDEAYRNLGRMKLSSAPDEAIGFLEKAIRIKNDPATEAMLAAARGKREDAVRLFQLALEEGDESADIHNDFAAVLAIVGRDQEALAQYQAALRVMPTHYDARMNLGALLSRLGREVEAIDQFTAAGQEHPHSSEPHIYLALTYANRGQLDKAIHEVDEAMTIDPVASNREFTNAVRMPFKESNLRDYLALLRSKTGANRG